ncbi:hypothetical protein pipiens_004584 [Culex pipiens pipiens]|uniref:Ig-like domain-containing protein n=1 Tax=Culex pipiens pipiens TaxID=38569 RepID=A0ABD1CHF1_CULPP
MLNLCVVGHLNYRLTVRSSSGGRPTPTVNWWYDNEIVNHSSTVLSERRVKNTLILSRLERKHLEGGLRVHGLEQQRDQPDLGLGHPGHDP